MKRIFCMAVGCGLIASSWADRVVLHGGQSLFATILKEDTAVFHYLDRYERPRTLPAAQVDSLIYDVNQVKGRVKVAFRKGQPTDTSGYVVLRHSEDLDLDVQYQTDSATELDLFFKNQAHVRVLENSRFKIKTAPNRVGQAVEMEMRAGRALVAGYHDQTVVKLITSAGIAVGRGKMLFALQASNRDSAMVVLCLQGLTGIQEKPESPGELSAEPLQALAYARSEGVFQPRSPDSLVVADLQGRSHDMLRYRLEPVENPPIGYLAQALTGLGFLVFFYGSALGILGYVNHI